MFLTLMTNYTGALVIAGSQLHINYRVISIILHTTVE